MGERDFKLLASSVNESLGGDLCVSGCGEHQNLMFHILCSLPLVNPLLFVMLIHTSKHTYKPLHKANICFMCFVELGMIISLFA